MSTQEPDDYEGEYNNKKASDQAVQDGIMLYSSLHLISYTGFFRILPIKDFRNILLFSYVIEFNLSVVPQLMYQLFNNYFTDIDNMTLVQTITLQAKITLLLWMLIEGTLFLWEYCKYKRMQKDRIPGYEKLTEE